MKTAGELYAEAEKYYVNHVRSLCLSGVHCPLRARRNDAYFAFTKRMHPSVIGRVNHG